MNYGIDPNDVHLGSFVDESSILDKTLTLLKHVRFKAILRPRIAAVMSLVIVLCLAGTSYGLVKLVNKTPTPSLTTTKSSQIASSHGSSSPTSSSGISVNTNKGSGSPATNSKTDSSPTSSAPSSKGASTTSSAASTSSGSHTSVSGSGGSSGGSAPVAPWLYI